MNVCAGRSLVLAVLLGAAPGALAAWFACPPHWQGAGPQNSGRLLQSPSRNAAQSFALREYERYRAERIERQLPVCESSFRFISLPNQCDEHGENCFRFWIERRGERGACLLGTTQESQQPRLLAPEQRLFGLRLLSRAQGSQGLLVLAEA